MEEELKNVYLLVLLMNDDIDLVTSDLVTERAGINLDMYGYPYQIIEHFY